MMFILIRYSVVLLAFIFIRYEVTGQEPRGSKAPELLEIYCDDFSEDTRGNYKTEGVVIWQKNQLSLNPGASITHEFKGGSWARIDLEVAKLHLGSAQNSELNIWFELGGATPCLVRVLRHEGGQTPNGIAIFDTRKELFGSEGILVRDAAVADSIQSLSIVYRHGVIEVAVNGGPRTAAYIENGSESIVACRIASQGESQVINKITVRTTGRSRDFSVEERRQLAEVEAKEEVIARMYSQGAFSDAAKIGSEVVETRKEILGEYDVDYSNSITNLASIYREIGDTSRAELLFIEAKVIREKVLGRDHPDYITSLENLAIVYTAIGDWARAESLFEEAKAICEKVLGKEHPDYGVCLNNLAYLYFSTGDSSRTERLLLEAKSINEKVLGNEHPEYAISLHNLAALYDSLGYTFEAEPLYREALAIEEQVHGKEHRAYASTLNSLGNLYSSIGDTSRAEPFYLEASAIRQKVLGNEHADYASSLNDLAEHYRSIGEMSRAQQLHIEAKRIREKVLGKEHPDYLISLNNTALLYSSIGDHLRAETLYREVIALELKLIGKEHPYYASSLHNLAGLYLSTGDTSRAEPLFLEALAIREAVLGKGHPDFAKSQNILGMLYMDRGRIVDSLPLFEQSLLSIRNHLDAAAYGLSERQQLSMYRANRYFLDNYIEACLRADPTPPSAFSNVVLWKGSVLYRLRQLRKVADDPSISDLFIKLQRASANLSKLAQAVPGPDQAQSWKKQIAKLVAEKELLESELIRSSATFRDATDRITLERIQRAVPQGAVLIDYLEYNSRSNGRSLMASIVKSDAPPTMISLGSAIEAGEAIDLWRETFGTSTQGEAAGLKLRKQIWEPLLSKIGDAETILISADGCLGRLALGALPGKESGTFLIEDHRLALIPVPQLFPAPADEQDRMRLEHELLLMGDVDYDAMVQADGGVEIAVNTASKRQGERGEAAPARGDQSWDYLAETGAEVTLIRDIYKKSRNPGPDAIVDLRKSAATETEFRKLAPQSTYLHLATHGFFAAADKKPAKVNDRAGMLSVENRDAIASFSPGQLSGLVFAGVNRPASVKDALNPRNQFDDGIMTSDEIAFLPLDGVRLAVLSACETGLGESAGGEGLLGIQRGFQIAGARSTVASLWKVNDAATRRIMQEFYTNYLEKNMSMLDSLREAQLWALRNPGEVPRGEINAPRAAPVLLPNAKVVDANIGAAKSGRLSPQYWAPFVLSGDWK